MFGVSVIEKHFTYRKENQTFHDHAISADPKDMKKLVKDVRQAEIIFGSYKEKEVNRRTNNLVKYEKVLCRCYESEKR